MGKQGSLRSPRPEHPNGELPFGVKEYQFRCVDVQPGGDHCMGRRTLGADYRGNKVVLFHGLKNDYGKFGAGNGVYAGKRHMWWIRRHGRSIVFTFLLMGFLFFLDSFMFTIFDPRVLQKISTQKNSTESKDIATPRNSVGGTKESRTTYGNDGNKPIQMYDRLLNLASSALIKRELKKDTSKFWEETFRQASSWKPCADSSTKTIGKPSNTTGYILVSANGGLNQQRVAVCNAIAVAYLLNATLVIPRFLYSNVWKDPSQFGDIYQEEYFMDTMKDDVNIVKELPSHLRSLDLEAIGSQITDADIPKAANSTDYIKKVLPLLLRNGVVHLLGFGNRLGFDPLPFELQRLRCKCNFHALKFAPKIQEVGSLLVSRIRKYKFTRNMIDKQLLGNFSFNGPLNQPDARNGPSKYLALHLRFEIDMVAYSLCEFGGSENEKRELQSYRETHFPLLLERLKKSELIPPSELRKLGGCLLTPEEAALVLAGLGFRRGSYIYLASSQIYGGESRIHPLRSLYPNLVTKEILLTPNELEPFRNYSSQLAALDFIACAIADVFAMTDSGSQLASLVSGIRRYYGGGHAPTLRPSKQRLAAILSEKDTISWKNFEQRIQKMIGAAQQENRRRFGQSIYRQPSCLECMCKSR